MHDHQDQFHRVSPGAFSVTVFIGSTIYLVLLNHGWQSLLTFKAVLFLLLGILFAVVLVGVPFHLLRSWLEKILFKPAETRITSSKIQQIKAVVTVLMVIQVVLTFYVTKIAYVLYFS